jgi:hypothetical protein
MLNSIMTKKWLSVIALIMISFFTIESVQSKEKVKKVIGTFPETLDIHYSDPPCDCLVGDDFSIIKKGTESVIAFYVNSYTYLNTYYELEKEYDEEEWPGYGGASYRLKEEYIGKEFTITYKNSLCPGYKSCASGKIYKNMIVSIE